MMKRYKLSDEAGAATTQPTAAMWKKRGQELDLDYKTMHHVMTKRRDCRSAAHPGTTQLHVGPKTTHCGQVKLQDKTPIP